MKTPKMGRGSTRTNTDITTDSFYTRDTVHSENSRSVPFQVERAVVYRVYNITIGISNIHTYSDQTIENASVKKSREYSHRQQLLLRLHLSGFIPTAFCGFTPHPRLLLFIGIPPLPGYRGKPTETIFSNNSVNNWRRQAWKWNTNKRPQRHKIKANYLREIISLPDGILLFLYDHSI